MRRRKPTITMQINVRLDTELVRQLETRAKASRATLSEQIRTRLIDSLDPKPEPSLADFRASWLHRLRNAVEHAAKENIESAWPVLQLLDAKFSHFCGDAETELQRYVRDPKVRELLRGAPTLPNETKAKKE